MNKIIIFALVAIIFYHLFIKEGFAQKTNCSLYTIPQLCNIYKSKGCSINPNKVMGDNKDFCICTDPSKGCEEKKAKWNTVIQTYTTYISLKPGAAKGGLSTDPDVVVINQGIKKDGTFNFGGETEMLFQVLGDEYKKLYTRYEMMVRQGI